MAKSNSKDKLSVAVFGDASFPDMAFAIVLPSGKKENGITRPTNLRKLPHHNKNVKSADENSSVDLSHLRNALARLSNTDAPVNLKTRAKSHLVAHAKALLPTSKFVKSDYYLNLREVMSYIISGQMNFTQAMNSLNATPNDLEDLMLEYFNDKNDLPDNAYAIEKLFPHHNINVKNSHEQGTVNKTLLKFQIARIKDSNIPIGTKLKAMAHLMGHARVLFPNSTFVEENKILGQGFIKSDIHGEEKYSIYLTGITEDADGHSHSYDCEIDEDGYCMGMTNANSNDSNHRHMFAGKMKNDGTMQTTGSNKSPDHKHTIDFGKKKSKINKMMPNVMKERAEICKAEAKEIKIGRMRIAL